MDEPRRRSWFRPMVFVSLAYVMIGLGFPALAASPGIGPARFWRLAAWAGSAIVGVAHVVFERYRLGRSPRSAALHAAGAVALGAFGLALAANVHDLGSGSAYRARLLIALIAWPVLTAPVAFVLALVVSLGLPVRIGHHE